MTKSWKAESLRALDDAREFIEKADGNPLIAVFVIEEKDLLKDRPISFFANIKVCSLPWLLSYAVYRLLNRQDCELKFRNIEGDE